MTTATPTALPRLGDHFTRFTLTLSMQRKVNARDGCVIRSYGSELGPLTVLFDRGSSVAIYFPYSRPAPRHADLMALRTRLAPADGTAHHLLIADQGWILATDACPRAWLQVLLQAATPWFVALHGQPTGWE